MISALAVYPVLGLTGWQKEEGEEEETIGERTWWRGMWQRCVVEIRRGTADILPLSVIYYACSKDMENQWSHQGVTTATTNIKGFATVKKERMKENWLLGDSGGGGHF